MKGIIYLLLVSLLSSAIAPTCASAHEQSHDAVGCRDQAAASDDCCHATADTSDSTHDSSHSHDSHPPCHCLCCHAPAVIKASLFSFALEDMSEHLPQSPSKDYFHLFVHNIWQPPQG